MNRQQSKTLNEARDRFFDTLAVLQKSRALYLKNKHRSLPNRGPYASALRVAQQTLEHAKRDLEEALLRFRKANHIRGLRESMRDELAQTRAEGGNQSTSTLINLQKRQREYLAKIQFAQELESQAIGLSRRANAKL